MLLACLVPSLYSQRPYYDTKAVTVAWGGPPWAYEKPKNVKPISSPKGPVLEMIQSHPCISSSLIRFFIQLLRCAQSQVWNRRPSQILHSCFLGPSPFFYFSQKDINWELRKACLLCPLNCPVCPLPSPQCLIVINRSCLPSATPMYTRPYLTRNQNPSSPHLLSMTT